MAAVFYSLSTSIGVIDSIFEGNTALRNGAGIDLDCAAEICVGEVPRAQTLSALSLRATMPMATVEESTCRILPLLWPPPWKRRLLATLRFAALRCLARRADLCRSTA